MSTKSRCVPWKYILLLLIFAGTNFRGDRIDHISRVLVFADLPIPDISRVLIFADCRWKFTFFTFQKAKKVKK